MLNLQFIQELIYQFDSFFYWMHLKILWALPHNVLTQLKVKEVFYCSVCAEQSGEQFDMLLTADSKSCFPSAPHLLLLLYSHICFRPLVSSASSLPSPPSPGFSLAAVCSATCEYSITFQRGLV